MKKSVKRMALLLVTALVMSLTEPAGVTVRAENAGGVLAGDAENGYYINMPAGGTTELTVPEGVDMFKVYDNGGANGGYSDNCNGYLLLTAPEGHVLSLTGTVQTESVAYDWLTVYDGNSTACSSLGPNTKYGSAEKEKLYLLSSSGNQMLLYFRSDGGGTNTGLDLSVYVRSAEIAYQISENSVQGGTLEFYAGGNSVTKACATTEVTVVAKPADGYDLTGVLVTDIHGNTILHQDGFWYTDDRATFKMPSTDVVVQGVFTNTSTEENGIFQTIPDSGTKELKIASGVDKFKIYNSGGTVGGYGNYANGYLLLTAPENYTISLSGQVTTEGEGVDYMMMYDGNSTEAKQLGAKSKYGNSSGDVVEYLTSSGNQVLLYFYSDSGVALTGVNLTVTIGATDRDYNIVIVEDEGGEIETFAEGEVSVTAQGNQTVTVVATPGYGYDLTGMVVTDSLGRELVVNGGFWYTDNTGTFVMPAMDVTVKCIFTYTSSGVNEIYQTIPDAGTKELKIAKDVKSFKIYSSRGMANGYDNYANGYLLLTAPENFIMKLNGTMLTENNAGDYLTIYDGDTAAENMIAGNSSKYGNAYVTTIDTIVSSKNRMLLYFASDQSHCNNGADLTVTLSDLSRKYDIQTSAPVNGTVVYMLDGEEVTSAPESKTVTVTATPEEGYMLTGITVRDMYGNSLEVTGGNWHTGNTGTFLMPESRVTVSPEFAEIETMEEEMYQNLPSVGSVEISIPREIRSFKLYDIGGRNGAYHNDSDCCAYITAPEGYFIQIEGSVWTEDTRDYLYIYDGDGILADKILGQKFTGPDGVNTGILTSTGNKMCLYFHTDSSVVYEGLDLTLRLVPVTYQITYDLSGGEMKADETNPETYTADDVITLKNPVREGYVFAGWTGTDISDVAEDVSIPIGSYGDREYKATWRKLLTHEDVTIDVAEQTYTGMFVDPLTVMDGDTLLERDKDFKAVYRLDENETEYPMKAGTYEIVITGIGTYTGSVEKEFVNRYTILKVVGLTAQDRAYDRTDEVCVEKVILDGILGTDMVCADVGAMKAKVGGKECGEYTEVSFEEVPLTGTDAENYLVLHPGNPFELDEPVTIYKAENAIRMPASAMKVNYTTKTVGAIKLPQDWAWKASDAGKALGVSKTVTAMALYAGADKDNYENISVLISITRQPCVHTWNTGAVSVAPTAVAKGKKTYICSVCKGTKTEDIPALGLLKKGATIADAKSGIQYKVTKSAASGGTVEVKKATNKKVKSVKIPDAVVIDGVTYKVTSIAKSAFSGCTKLKTVTVGKNVTKIGAKAFYKCKNLKTVTIKTTKLKAKAIGKQAFKGTPKKMTLKVPKKKMSLYKKILKAQGVNKKAKYKKI
nr:leucine-rich repeat protein [Lachnospiraceae bacterium]